MWKDVLFVQRCLRKSRDYTYVKKFDADCVDYQDLFEFAIKEPKIIIGKIPAPSFEYISE